MPEVKCTNMDDAVKGKVMRLIPQSAVSKLGKVGTFEDGLKEIALAVSPLGRPVVSGMDYAWISATSTNLKGYNTALPYSSILFTVVEVEARNTFIRIESSPSPRWTIQISFWAPIDNTI